MVARRSAGSFRCGSSELHLHNSLARFGNVLGTQHLARAGSGRYCPECVRTGDGQQHGQLLWEVDCVQACPVHGVRLRAAGECGAPDTNKLILSRRPLIPGVCSHCGSIGFRCLSEKGQPASRSDIWVAASVGRLVALSTPRSQALSTEKLRLGLRDLVDQRFDGRTVNSALEAGLPRSIVGWWIRGDGMPTLGKLMALCYRAEADIVALIEGRYSYCESTGVKLQVSKRRYKRTRSNWSDVGQALVAATHEEPVPSVSEIARRFGVSPQLISRRLPRETALLVSAFNAFRERQRNDSYNTAFNTYSASAIALKALGRPVSKGLLIRHSGLFNFGNDSYRKCALTEVIRIYA